MFANCRTGPKLGATGQCRWRRALLAGNLALWLPLAACEEDHPYTPFQVASSLPSSPPPPTAPVPVQTEQKPASFTPAKLLRKPPAASWTVANQKLEAPRGFQLERALRADFDGDGKQETVAWVVPEKDPLRRPEVWLYPAAGATRRLFVLPGFVPSGPTCSLRALLQQTGPQTVTLDVTGSCEARMIARAPVRSLAVLAPMRSRPVVLALRAAEGGPGERLSLAVTTLDRDNDGRDDVALSVSMHSGKAASAASAKFLWYDREAGASRDDSEPGVSMAKLASREVVRANGKKTSLAVPEVVRNLKRLYGAVCDEAGTPRLFDAEGDGLSCGRLTTTFSRLARAEISAQLKNQRVLEALGVLLRDGWFAHPADEKELEERRALFDGHLSRKSARLERILSVTPPRPGATPRFSPLEFKGNTTLLVQTPTSVETFDIVGQDVVQVIRMETEDAPELPGLAPWPLTVVSDQGRHWNGVVHSCDRAEVTLSFSDAQGVPLPSQPIDVLAPRPGSCRGGRPPRALPAVPLGWNGNELVAWASGSRIGPRQTGTRPLGSAVSQNGTWTVYPTPLGLYLDGAKPALWEISSKEVSPENLRDCVVSNDGHRVACLQNRRVLLIEGS